MLVDNEREYIDKTKYYIMSENINNDCLKQWWDDNSDGYCITNLPHIDDLANGISPIIKIVEGLRDVEEFVNREDISRGELFYDINTHQIYIVDKGDLETYWLKIAREEKIEERENKNPFLD